MELEAKLNRHLGDDLYRHSLGVAQTAVCLAERYGRQRDQAYIAGMVHDYAKIYSGEKLRRLADQMNLNTDWISLAEPGLLHGPVGAALLPEELGIRDKEIIEAVTYHTTCRQGASLLEKIVYLSDYIEPGRCYPSVENIRVVAQYDLNAALLETAELTIKKVLDRGKLLHPRTVEFRNSLLSSKS